MNLSVMCYMLSFGACKQKLPPSNHELTLMLASFSFLAYIANLPLKSAVHS